MFFLYKRATSPTGRVLGRALGGRWGTERYLRGTEDLIIRWGATEASDVTTTINKRDAIILASDKLRALEVLDDAGVPVVPFATHPTDFTDEEYPIFGRSRHHTRGSDIRIIESRAVMCEGLGCAFYTRYIVPQHEYRIHVVGGQVIRSQIKVLAHGTDAGNYSLIRNRANGWILNGMNSVRPHQDRLDAAINAVEALGLDFGAVDLVVGRTDNQPYVLEVNTAPRCDERTGMAYMDALTELVYDRTGRSLTNRPTVIERLLSRTD